MKATTLRKKTRAVLVTEVVRWESGRKAVVKLSENATISYGLTGVSKGDFDSGSVLAVRPVSKINCPRKWDFAWEGGWVLEVVEGSRNGQEEETPNS